MALLICTGCGHPADEHHGGGCMEVLDWDEAAGCMASCDCPRSVKALYDEAVANGRIPGAASGPRGRGGQG